VCMCVWVFGCRCEVMSVCVVLKNHAHKCRSYLLSDMCVCVRVCVCVSVCVCVCVRVCVCRVRG